MSTSYHSTVFYGVPIAPDSLVKHTLDPLWGKVKFNPQTGVRVLKYKTTKVDIEALARKCKLNCVTTTDAKSYFIGMTVGKLNHSYDEYMVLNLPNARVQAVVSDRIRKLLASIGHPNFDARFYNVGYCDY